MLLATMFSCISKELRYHVLDNLTTEIVEYLVW